MSTYLYDAEPPCKGKIVIRTNFGDIELELWTKEAPKACRNFLQLCLEGYYDHTVFHRIIQGFMIQGGDPTGTGTGGESIYGKPFADEIHSRLKFKHRGILAMANPNLPNCNASQFFITLDKCEWLNKKHTIFGKVVGNTIFNVMRMGELETDRSDRPLDPPEILSTEVVENPIKDIVPRRLEKKTSESQVLQKKLEKKKDRKKRLGKKRTALLSFGEEEEAGFSSLQPKGKKMRSSHDMLAAVDPTLTNDIAIEDVEDTTKRRAKRQALKDAALGKSETGDEQFQEKVNALVQSREEKIDPQKEKEKHKQRKRLLQQPIENLEMMDPKKRKQLEKERQQAEQHEEYKQLRSQMRAARKLERSEADMDEETRRKLEEDMLTPLQLSRKKYLLKSRNRKSRMNTTLIKLAEFQQRLHAVQSGASGGSAAEPQNAIMKMSLDAKRRRIQEEKEKAEKQAEEKSKLQEQEENTGIAIRPNAEEDDGIDDNDSAWMTAKLHFVKHIDDNERDDELIVIDDGVEKSASLAEIAGGDNVVKKTKMGAGQQMEGQLRGFLAAPKFSLKLAAKEKRRKK